MSGQLTLPRADRQCRLLEWKPWRNDSSSLLGHCAIAFSGGWVINSIPVFRGENGLSVGTPTIPQLDAGGTVKQRDGKRDYRPVISFETAEARERWQRLVLGALAAGGIGSPGDAP